MIAALDFKSVTLQPMEVRPISVTGSVFSCLTADAQFWGSFDGGPFIPLQGGIQIDNRPSLFTSVTLQNKSLVALTLTFYCGTCAVTYSPVTVQTTNTNANTYIKGSGVKAAATTFQGIDTANQNRPRKLIAVSNLDTSGNLLDVQDGNGNLLFRLASLETKALETKDVIIVPDPLGLNFCVAEVFYS